VYLQHETFFIEVFTTLWFCPVVPLRGICQPVNSRKTSLNSITMATVIILSHKAQNPSTANDHHTMAKVIKTHTS
jgi:hypothetical protein